MSQNAKLLKNWGKDVYEQVGDRIINESTSTTLHIAKILDNQFNESLSNPVYQNENLVSYYDGGVEKASGAIMESFNLLQKRGKLGGLTREEVEYLSEFVQKQHRSLDDGQAENLDTVLKEGIVIGDHGYDPVKIASGEMSGNIVNAGPAVVGMVKRVIPKLIALDICGTQTMSQSTGQYFGLRSVYGNNDLGDPKQGFDPDGKEMFHPELGPDIMHSGRGSLEVFEEIVAGKTLDDGDIYKFDFKFESDADKDDEKFATLLEIGESGVAYFQVNKAGGLTAPATGDLVEWVLDNSLKGTLFETGPAMATSVAELMEGYNKSTDNEWATVSFRVDKNMHEAKERKLKATSSVEAIQDMQKMLGMDVVSMLQNMIVDELTLEINREVITWVNASAELGKTGRTRTPGSLAGVFNMFDPVDTRYARHNAESAKAILYQIDKERNEILKRTGRGRGNVMLASPGVVTLIGSIPEAVTDAQVGFAQGKNLDFAQSTFAGVIGGMRTHLDQFARYEYFTIGYRGSQPIDAGLIFAPYILLTPKLGQDYRNFSPVIGYLSRYALAVNPMVNARIERPKHRLNTGMPTADVIRKNSYFRHVKVVNL